MKQHSQMRGRKRSFFRNRKGSTAVEFAMVAPLFLGLIFSIFETGYFYYQQSVIEEVAARAAREIRVGLAPSASYTSADPDECQTGKDCFYDTICQPLDWFGSCEANLSVDVQTFTSFTALNDDLSDTSCPSDDAYDYDALSYDPGESLSIVRIRVCYLVRTLNPALGMKLTRTTDNRRAVIAVSIIRNEPYEGA